MEQLINLVKAQISEMILQNASFMSVVHTSVLGEERFVCSVSGIHISANEGMNFR